VDHFALARFAAFRDSHSARVKKSGMDVFFRPSTEDHALIFSGSVPRCRQSAIHNHPKS